MGGAKPGEDAGLRGVGGGGREGLGGREARVLPADSEGEPVPLAIRRPLGMSSRLSMEGEVSLLVLQNRPWHRYFPIRYLIFHYVTLHNNHSEDALIQRHISGEQGYLQEHMCNSQEHHQEFREARR